MELWTLKDDAQWDKKPLATFPNDEPLIELVRRLMDAGARTGQHIVFTDEEEQKLADMAAPFFANPGRTAADAFLTAICSSFKKMYAPPPFMTCVLQDPRQLVKTEGNLRLAIRLC